MNKLNINSKKRSGSSGFVFTKIDYHRDVLRIGYVEDLNELDSSSSSMYYRDGSKLELKIISERKHAHGKRKSKKRKKRKKK